MAGVVWGEKCWTQTEILHIGGTTGKLLFNHCTGIPKYLFGGIMFDIIIIFLKEIQDFPARVQRQVFDDILDREVQRGMKVIRHVIGFTLDYNSKPMSYFICFNNVLCTSQEFFFPVRTK